MELEGNDIIVFDAEIKNVIDGKNITWKDFDKMGVSVAVAHHYKTGDTKVYLDDNLHELYKEINDATMVVGFNTLGFDIPLLKATKIRGEHGGEILMPTLRTDNHYDMLYWSRRATGWTEKAKFPSGLKLDNHLETMFGIKKTEDGANAPIFYQQGLLGRVISYCIADVMRERMLFENMWYNCFVDTAAHGKRTVQDPKAIFARLSDVSINH